MTKEAIQKECMKESLNWVDTGNGPVGRLFVEIIGCDNLPQMDTGGMLGNKTDAFVQLVFEDTMGRTDTIDDSLAPRWMPWTKRAFILHMYHASSDLFIAVFDYDASINPADEHDFIGRAAVDLSNLRKNIVYTLTYDLYTTSQMSNLSDKRIFRKRMGTVTFRLRLEIDDEKKILLGTLNPPPLMFVNVKTRKDFKVLQGATEGKYNMSRYDQDIIYS
jgi:C2 domain